MENFYLRYSKSFERNVEEEDCKKVDYKYEVLFVSKDNSLVLRNKHTKNERELGTINSEILKISKSNDENYTVIVTRDDILLFDSYLDMIGSVDLNKEKTKDFIEVQWAEDEFCVVFKTELLFFDVKLKQIGLNSNYEFRSVCYREKYNIFVCATKNKIVFIESNGLEHGEHIEIEAEFVSMITNDIMLCSKETRYSSTTINILYSKNFHWYKKQTKTYTGRITKIEKNRIYLENGSVEIILCGKVDRFDNLYMVVDGCKLLYYNMNDSKIPPPLSKYNINFKGQIQSVDIQNGSLLVHLPEKILRLGNNLEFQTVYKLDIDGFPETVDYCVKWKDCIVMFYEDKIFLMKDNNIEEVTIEGLLSVVYDNEPHNRINKDLSQSDSKLDYSSSVVDFRVFENDIPVFFLNDGSLILESIILKFNWDFMNSKIEVKKIDGDLLVGILIKNRFYFIRISTKEHKNQLFERVKEEFSKKNSKEDASCIYDIYSKVVEIYSTDDIESFIFDSRAFSFISSQYMKIILKNDQQSLFVDPEFKILGCSDLEIYGETRHGTLETFYPKAFSDIFVQKLIDNKEYSRAFELSNNDYSLFIRNVLDMKTLSKCSSKVIISFLIEVCKIFKDYRIILENEEIERLRRDLDDDLYLDNLDKVVTKDVEYISIVDLQARHILNLSGAYDPKDSLLLSADMCLDSIVDLQARNILNLSDAYDPKDRPLLSADMCLEYSDRSKFLNELFKNLNIVENLEIYLFLFVNFKRTDLAVRLSQKDLLRGIRYLMTITTIEDIKNAAILSLDRMLILDVYKIIQQDATDIINLMNINENVQFKLCCVGNDFERALYYLICEYISKGNNDDAYFDILKTVEKHNLSRELLVLSCVQIFSKYSKILMEMFATTTTNHIKAIKVYKYLGKSEALVNLYIEKTMFREALEEYKGNKEDLYPDITRVLRGNGLFNELGMFYEEYQKDFDLAVENYLKSKKFSAVLRVIKGAPSEKITTKKIVNECVSIMKNQMVLLDNLFSKYKKYRDRLITISERDEDYYNDETSFSYTVVSDKSRGRPGGLYEKEFVLEKLRGIGLKIFNWREDIDDLLNIFNFFERKDCFDMISKEFNSVRDVLRSEYYDFFKDTDYTSFNNTKEKIQAPDLSKYI
ncbi:hypothetical protein NGRA_0443 [Nosema granulosis]|uniref:Elongator complex protein 1 n=1 Tax=Nosema granulosis TaxID=83296 RepID=A0A9P6H1Z7_9MICR|nr:hypothetical protein NGRA_0443 [Nosema granulosis]